MNNTQEYLRTELRALEDQIAALREQIRQEDGLAMDRSQKQLKALLLQQKEMEEKLQALKQSSQKRRGSGNRLVGQDQQAHGQLAKDPSTQEEEIS